MGIKVGVHRIMVWFSVRVGITINVRVDSKLLPNFCVLGVSKQTLNPTYIEVVCYRGHLKVDAPKIKSFIYFKKIVCFGFCDHKRSL